MEVVFFVRHGVFSVVVNSIVTLRSLEVELVFTVVVGNGVGSIYKGIIVDVNVSGVTVDFFITFVLHTVVFLIFVVSIDDGIIDVIFGISVVRTVVRLVGTNGGSVVTSVVFVAFIVVVEYEDVISDDDECVTLDCAVHVDSVVDCVVGISDVGDIIIFSDVVDISPVECSDDIVVVVIKSIVVFVKTVVVFILFTGPLIIIHSFA